MLSHRAKEMTPSVTLEISTRVKALKEKGATILDLSIGEPDFFTPDPAKNMAIEAINTNQTKYGAASGLLALRQAICNKLLLENKVSYAPEQIVVTSGAKHAITNTLMALIDPGDEVIVPVPYWVSYPEMVKLTGGVPVFVKTQYDNDFKLTKEELQAAVTSKTKAIFITNPSNPTGAVYKKEELLEICTFCAENNIYILADEIYERICYLDSFTSVASLSDAIKEMTITINGMSKSVSMTGWRIGYTASPLKLATAMASIQGHLVSHPSTISQHAALGGLSHCSEEIHQMKQVYQTRRDKVIAWMGTIDGLSLVKPQGAFYVFINISTLREQLQVKHLSVEVCKRLLDAYHVALVPGLAFGHDDFIRLSYATDLETIEEAIKRLGAFVASLT